MLHLINRGLYCKPETEMNRVDKIEIECFCGMFFHTKFNIMFAA